MKVTVLGASGMLGSMLTDYLSKYYTVSATVRDKTLIKDIPNVDWHYLDARRYTPFEIERELCNSDWVINAIGIIRHKLTDGKEAFTVNSRFPFNLSVIANKYGFKVLTIATDCVYSGQRGLYTEDDYRTPTDQYGTTKALGEVTSACVSNLRCSIVGPARDNYSLLEWFLSQPPRATIKGFTNHLWNGLTTLHFAKICRGIMESQQALPNIQHIVPAGYVSKYELLCAFRDNFNREDITINQTLAAEAKDMRLATKRPEVNKALWRAAGYPEPPSIYQMVKELSEYVKSNHRAGNKARDFTPVESHT